MTLEPSAVLHIGHGPVSLFEYLFRVLVYLVAIGTIGVGTWAASRCVTAAHAPSGGDGAGEESVR